MQQWGNPGRGKRHGRRIGRVVREGFLEKETIEKSFEDEDELQNERKKESDVKVQMDEFKS